MNVEQKQKVLKIFNRLFNEADTTNMPVERIIEISEAIDLVKNLHIPVVSKTFYCRNNINTSYKDAFCEMTQCDECKQEENKQ